MALKYLAWRLARLLLAEAHELDQCDYRVPSLLSRPRVWYEG